MIKVHSTAEYGKYAEKLDGMLNKWTNADNLAAGRGYNDHEFNAEADALFTEYEGLRQEVVKARKLLSAQRPAVARLTMSLYDHNRKAYPRMVAKGDRSGVTAVDESVYVDYTGNSYY